MNRETATASRTRTAGENGRGLAMIRSGVLRDGKSLLKEGCTMAKWQKEKKREKIKGGREEDARVR